MYRSQTPEETLAKAKALYTSAEVYWQRRVIQRKAIEALLKPMVTKYAPRHAGDVK